MIPRTELGCKLLSIRERSLDGTAIAAVLLTEQDIAVADGAERWKLEAERLDDLNEALEWLFVQQKEGKIDAKTADALNTTIKQASYLNGKLKLDYLKLLLSAKIKKIELPQFPMLEA